MRISKPTDSVPNNPWGIDASTFTSLWGPDDFLDSRDRAAVVTKEGKPENRQDEASNNDYRGIQEMEMEVVPVKRNRHAGVARDPLGFDEEAFHAEFEMGLGLVSVASNGDHTRDYQGESSSLALKDRTAPAHQHTQERESTPKQSFNSANVHGADAED